MTSAMIDRRVIELHIEQGQTAKDTAINIVRAFLDSGVINASRMYWNPGIPFLDSTEKPRQNLIAYTAATDTDDHRWTIEQTTELILSYGEFLPNYKPARMGTTDYNPRLGTIVISWDTKRHEYTISDNPTA